VSRVSNTRSGWILLQASVSNASHGSRDSRMKPCLAFLFHETYFPDDPAGADTDNEIESERPVVIRNSMLPSPSVVRNDTVLNQFLKNEVARTAFPGINLEHQPPCFNCSSIRSRISLDFSSSPNVPMRIPSRVESSDVRSNQISRSSSFASSPVI